MELKKDTLVIQDPESNLDYFFDFYDGGNAFLGSGDTISTATFTTTSGLTLSDASYSSTVATVWVSGGTVGQVYTVNCRMVSAAGRTKDASVNFLIEEN